MRSSKVLQEETVEEIENGSVVMYGTYRGIWRITVKGTYTPTVERTINEFQQMVGEMEKQLRKLLERMLAENGHGHRIIETDITDRGLKFGKRAKYRITVYVVPAADSDALQIGKTIYTIAESALADNFFTLEIS